MQNGDDVSVRGTKRLTLPSLVQVKGLLPVNDLYQEKVKYRKLVISCSDLGVKLVNGDVGTAEVHVPVVFPLLVLHLFPGSPSKLKGG